MLLVPAPPSQENVAAARADEQKISADAATTMEAIGTVLGVIPDIFVGSVDFVQLAIGSKLAQVFQGIARKRFELLRQFFGDPAEGFVPFHGRAPLAFQLGF